MITDFKRINCIFVFFFILFIMSKNIILFLICLLLISILSSCQKDDILPPTIKIIAPIENAPFQVGDSVCFHFYVSDNVQVSRVSVVLLDEQNRMLGAYRHFYSQENSLEIADYYYIADTTLSSGNYYLKFIAWDGYNEVWKSVKIKINGIPQKTIGLFAIIQSSSHQTDIYQVDTNNISSLWAQFNADFLDARIDNLYEHLYLFPKFYGNMSAINLQTKTADWTVSRLSTASAEWFQGIELIDHRLFVGDYNSNLTIYDNSGGITSLFAALPNFTVKKMLASGGVTFLYEVPKGIGQQKRIAIYNLGMNLIQNIIFDHDLVCWFPRDEDNMTLFYNTDEGFEIANLYYYLAGVTVIGSNNDYVLLDVEKISATSFLLGTDKGILYYDLNHPNTFSVILTKENVNNIEINEVNSQVAASSGNEMFIFSFPAGTISETFIFPDEVRQLFWHYNK
jgi:hypothetical protein